MLTQPTAPPRDQTALDNLCVATDFETGQLQGEVGTPEKPQFTFLKRLSTTGEAEGA